MEKPHGRFVYVLWLLPAAPAREALRAVIAQLAETWDAPVFEPHLTLGLGDLDSLDRAGGGSIHLRVEGIDFSPEFTKTLFVRFENSAALRALREEVGLDGQSFFDPHLSLLYSSLPEEQQRDLVHAIDLPFASVSFDSVAVVRCDFATESRDAVEAWETVGYRKIG